MRRFAALFQRLDQSTATGDKLAALVEYLSHAPPEDAAWAIWLLVGGKIGGAKARIASGNELRQWVSEETETPSWLVDASYHEVGDLAETLALLMPEPLEPPTEFGLGSWITERLAPVANADAPMRRDCIVDAWRRLPFAQRLVFNKLLTGALRVGVSHGLVQKALAQWCLKHAHLHRAEAAATGQDKGGLCGRGGVHTIPRCRAVTPARPQRAPRPRAAPLPMRGSPRRDPRTRRPPARPRAGSAR